MSDGTTINPSTLAGGDVIDTESIGARGKIQRVKLALGALDVDGGDVTGANPLPVTGTITATCSGTSDVTDRAARLLGHVTVDAAPAITGTVAVSNLPATQAVSAAALPLPAGAAQEHTTAASPHAVRVSNGAAFVDPTQVRALTSADVVTANVGTTGGLALDATLTGGAQKAITRGGAKGSTAAADVTSAAVDANTQALHTSVTNFPATQPVSIAATVTTDVSDRAARLVGHVTVDAATIAQLPSALAPSGALAANDRYTANEALADQAGAAGVLTFTFANGAPDLIWVQSTGGTSRAVIGAQTPSATLGSYCADGVPTPHTISGASSIKVYAPSGATVSVWGFRY